MKSDSPALSFWVGAVLAFGLLLHLAGINQPFLGNFAQHQTDYATVVQRWQETSIRPALPLMRFLALGKNRVFLGDFPLNITAVAAAVKFTGISIEMAGRGLSALFFFLSLVPFFQLAFYALKNKTAAFWALLFYVFSPLALVYGQAFLLEMTALSYAVFGYYCFFLWIQKGSFKFIIGAAFFFSLMLSTRIYFAPVLLPLAFLFLDKQGPGFVVRKEAWVLAALSLALPLLWQVYAAQTAQAQNDQSSLSDNMKVFVLADPVMRKNLMTLSFYVPILKTAFFKVLNPAFFMLAFVEAVSAKGFLPARSKKFLLSIFIAFVPLFLIAPRKFVEFDYYFLPFVPPAAILASAGWQRFSANVRPFWRVVFISAGVLLSLRFSLAPMLIVPNEDRNVRNLGRVAQEMIPSGARVLAAHGSSTSLLYYLNRDGWPFELPDEIGGVRNRADHEGTAVERLERFRSQGAAYFALAKREDERMNPGFFQYIKSNYRTIYDTSQGLLVDLAKQA